jgi:transposase
LCRQLVALGATCLVVRPRRLERYGRRRKTDKRDAAQPAADLAHHRAGRTGLLIAVRIPTVAEELRRRRLGYRTSHEVYHGSVLSRRPQVASCGKLFGSCPRKRSNG